MALPSPVPSPVRVEDAVPADWARIAELTVAVYRDERLAADEYLGQLADVAGRAGRSRLVVARAGGRVVGAVALVLDGDFGEITASDDEAAFRMLVVDPAVRGGGVGELLVRECLDRARAAGRRRMVLSTDPRMAAAHRLYTRLGFTRLPERDWAPRPGIDLLVYALEL
ncbi:MAG TPA: GNAT family N-acetyltransferase [Geodermatophilus sp.]|nr:GNAT family N-acetyltransferase [Geodermatophilus sp.]